MLADTAETFVQNFKDLFKTFKGTVAAKFVAYLATLQTDEHLISDATLQADIAEVLKKLFPQKK